MQAALGASYQLSGTMRQKRVLVGGPQILPSPFQAAPSVLALNGVTIWRVDDERRHELCPRLDTTLRLGICTSSACQTILWWSEEGGGVPTHWNSR